MPEEFEKKVKSKQKKKIAIWTTVGVATVALGLGLGLGFGLKGEKLYEIDLSSSLENAEILGEGKYKLGEEITIKAKEVENYRFSHWELNGKAVSTDSTYTFTLSMETIGSYKAVYVEDTVTANIYIDGTMSTKDVSKGTTLLEIVEQTDITDENSCGWFLDDKLIQVADLTQEMNENTNLYTKRATLDNLTFTFSRDESTYEVACTDTTTTEDIVVPKKYDGKTVVLKNEAFNSCKSISITLPAGIKELPSWAFVACEKVNVSLPDTLVELMDAFYEVTDMDIYLPNSLTSTGVLGYGMDVRIHNLGECKNLKAIDSAAFYGCTIMDFDMDLRKLPNLTTIGGEAFYGCYWTTDSIIIPDTITNIYGAFPCEAKDVTVYSAYVYNATSTGESGALYSSAKKVRVPKSIVDDPNNSNETLNYEYSFTKTEDGKFYIFLAK